MTIDKSWDRERSESGSWSSRKARRLQAVRVGNLRVLALEGEHERELLAYQLWRQGWSVRRTFHFLLAWRSRESERPVPEERLLAHWLSERESDNRLVDYLQQELVSIGWLQDEADFSAALNALVVSFEPARPLRAWRLFALNTFTRLSERIAQVPASIATGTENTEDSETIASFAAIYRRLFSLLQGNSLLDVGCACAYWPLLVAKGGHCLPGPIVAVDRRVEALRLSALLAETLGLAAQLRFEQQDLCQPAFLRLGQFDTVTAIHLLEHLEESQLPLALDQLLQVTRRRLLIVVPYEEQAQICYGHRQVFSTAKLQFWGQWCLEQLEGRATYWCEDLLGGLLVVERHHQP
ncbi:MAG: class I SAM-dependent methyltransferase [Thermogemmatispora sp.]|uniref:class I SAM-dependent methyltransferase n=1 Tax=Thermogemmatispora TaxID=768669 RepID=UPI00147884A4|nr:MULTISPECIES: class I SAM-dependent methyltransferase [Thermogemmatispora]MBE3566980.1 class I SAM-dependent methyltransferase [Thermogemmatispora sp.]